MKNKLEKLEAIRGLAAIYVVFHHSFFSNSFKVFGYNFSFLFRFGQEAVILFFLMSGFVIGYSFENSRDKSFWSYFQKRFYRIYIPLIIVLATNYILTSLQRGYLLDPAWQNLLGNFFMLQDTGGLKPNVLCAPYLGNTPLWSLSYEWWFYISFYIFYALFRKSRHIELFVAVLIVLSSATYLWYPNFANRLFMYYGIWWIGVVMAKSYLKNDKVKLLDLKISGISLSIATALLAFNCYIHADKITTIGVSPVLELRHFVFTIFVVVIALIWQNCNWKYFNTVVGKFAIFAPVSYALYISHYFLVSNATYLQFLDNKYLTFFIYLTVATAYSYLIEVILYPKIRSFFINKHPLREVIKNR